MQARRTLENYESYIKGTIIYFLNNNFKIDPWEIDLLYGAGLLGDRRNNKIPYDSIHAIRGHIWGDAVGRFIPNNFN